MSTYLIHHGIKGQRWGIRRYENADGTLTEAGKRRYSKATVPSEESKKEGWHDADKLMRIKGLSKERRAERKALKEKIQKRCEEDPVYKKAYKRRMLLYRINAAMSGYVAGDQLREEMYRREDDRREEERVRERGLGLGGHGQTLPTGEYHGTETRVKKNGKYETTYVLKNKNGDVVRYERYNRRSKPKGIYI